MMLDVYSMGLGIAEGIPKFVVAVMIFALGWIVAVGIGRFVAEVLRKLKFNQVFETGELKAALEKAEWKIDPAGFIGEIAKWILVIIFLLIAVEIVGLTQFANFLNSVVIWLPNVIVAVIIFVVAVVIADYLAKLVRVVLEGMKIKYTGLAEGIVKWSIWIFAIFAILIQLGIAKELILTLFTGIVAFLVIAGGLAFGLGGRDVAAEILRDLQKKFKE